MHPIRHLFHSYRAARMTGHVAGMGLEPEKMSFR
jgi:hypothetical protein